MPLPRMVLVALTCFGCVELDASRLVGVWGTGSFTFSSGESNPSAIWQEDLELEIWDEHEGALSGMYVLSETEPYVGGVVDYYQGELTGHHLADARVVVYLVGIDWLFDGHYLEAPLDVLRGNLEFGGPDGTFSGVEFSREPAP